MLKTRSAADDAAQDVFLNAYRSIKTFQGVSSFSTWLHRIAANRCLDLLRRKTREKEESLEALVESQRTKIYQFQDRSKNQDEFLEDADLIEKVMRHLPPEYRLILTLRELQGLSYQEISETLECSLDAVKARLRRARLECEEILRHFSAAGCV
jgi:RNA polymerase sigma-70 factor (ECF subfamily)